MTGAFIVVEGIDGSGSTTQALRLTARLRELGRDAFFTHEPSKGPVGTFIRDVLQHRIVVEAEGGNRAPDWSTMALLFAADRADHTERVIRPAIGRGEVVVSDRYTLSSLVYQSSTAPNRDGQLSWLREMNRAALVPTLLVVIDVSAAVAAERRARRGGHPELFETDALQVRLAEAYARAEEFVGGDQPLVHVDGNRSVDEVYADLETAVLRVLGGAGEVGPRGRSGA